MIKVDDYWWPEGELVNGGVASNPPGHWVAQQSLSAKIYAGLCPRKRVAVQAGGNVGIFPVTLAREGFETILSFEPDPKNFEALVINTLGFPGIHCFNMALSNTGERYQVIHNEANSGASYLMAGVGSGTLPAGKLDDLNLLVLDLLQLDIEGMEYFALRGAIDTVERCRPVIVWEFNSCAQRYGITEIELITWMERRKYALHDRRGKDQVWMPL